MDVRHPGWWWRTTWSWWQLIVVQHYLFWTRPQPQTKAFNCYWLHHHLSIAQNCLKIISLHLKTQQWCLQLELFEFWKKPCVVCVVSGHHHLLQSGKWACQNQATKKAGGFFSFIVSPKPDLTGFCSIYVGNQSRKSRTCRVWTKLRIRNIHTAESFMYLC